MNYPCAYLVHQDRGLLGIGNLLLFKIKPWAAKEKPMLPMQFKQECPELISSTVT